MQTVFNKPLETEVSENKSKYCVCTTAADAAEKIISITDSIFELNAGVIVNVLFQNANTADSPTLNVNSTGAKNIFYRGYQITSGTNKNALKDVVQFIYDGTNWRIIGNLVDTSNTAGASATSGIKMYPVAAFGQYGAAQTFTNSNVYIGADNELYSNNKKVATQTDITTLSDKIGSVGNTDLQTQITSLNSNIAKKIDKEYAEEKRFETKTWNGLSGFYGSYIWTDGENTYYSDEYDQYVLDKTTSTWSVKTWNGLSGFDGSCVWTDGENIYYSNGEDNQYVLDKSTSTWSVKTWNGFSDFTGPDVWTDGENIYCSKDSDHQYILDKSTSTWNIKTWNGLSEFYGGAIWTDGENTYLCDIFNQYVLDKATSTWSVKTWEGLSDAFLREGIWTDGENIYYSFYSAQYVLDKATSTWSAKTWEGLSEFLGEDVWTDGENIYYSSEANHYILDSKPKLLIGTNGSFTPITLQSFMIDAVASNAGAHNGIYRGKCLGTAVTSAQYSAISSGTFDDLYIGDYWTIGDHNWVICDFDYYIRCGSVDVDQHHLVMMPSESMYIPDGTALYGASGTLTRLVGEGMWARNWNATSEAPTTHTTAGGYKYSRMRTVIMKAANTIVIDAFGSEHVLPFTELYYSPAAATDSGLASGWAWFADDDQSSAMSKSICDLCNETMVYGQQVWGRGSAYTNVGFEIGLDKFQLAIFALNRNFANTRYDWWLRSVASATQAAYVSNYGTAGLFSSASALGVRPRFLLVG